jgi:hypothetical protein
MKRKTRRTRRQLALLLQSERRTLWPADTQSALIVALADLLLEALGRDEAHLPVGDRGDEPEDQR